MSSRRRSTMSASAPAGNPTRKTGRLVAACTSATTTGEGVREVISHAAPTFCIHVPILEVSDAIQRAQKTGSRSGSHRSEEHTSELQSHHDLVCRLLLEK